MQESLRRRVYRRRLIHGLRFRPTEIDLYSLLDTEDPTQYVSNRLYQDHIRPILNPAPARGLVDSKWAFYALAASHAIAVPHTYALYDPVFGVCEDSSPCRTADDLLAFIKRLGLGSAVIKPAGGLQGRALLIFDEIDPRSDEALLRDGRRVSLERTIRELSLAEEDRVSSVPGFVIQEPIAAHPDIHRLAPYTTNTVRIVTHIEHGGEARVLFAVLKLGRRGGMADNWAAGGIAIRVDESGRLAKGKQKPKYGNQWLTDHPDSGVAFEGIQLPLWLETIEASLRAARVFPGLRSIGWDVVITEAGPVFLEGNDDWDSKLVQAHCGGWLALPGVREDFAAYGIQFPTEVPSALQTVASLVGRRTRRLRR